VTPALIASDVDGTLLDDEETITPRTRSAVLAAVDAGARFVLATGRPPRWMVRIREVLGSGTAVCCNGAVLLDLETFTIVDEDALAPEVLEDVVSELRRRLPGTRFGVEYGLEFRHEPDYHPRWDVNAPGVATASLQELVTAPVAKLLARHEEADAERFVAIVEEVVADRATVTSSSSDALAEISALGITKATGLAKVAAHHGVDAADIVVFGDMPNDIAAFEWVRAAGGRAVAMAHAHPDVLAVATDVTQTNEDDGVAEFLRSL
jgi:Cof subfamily protein (haloacid dehalogenase superfamily)